MVHNWQTLLSAEGEVLGWVCGSPPPPRLVHRTPTTAKGTPRVPLPADPHAERCAGCGQLVAIAAEEIPGRFNLNDMVA